MSQSAGKEPIITTPEYKPISKKELDSLIVNDQDRKASAYDYNGVANPANPNYRPSLYQANGAGADVEDSHIDERVW
jgi:hypothetical protein